MSAFMVGRRFAARAVLAILIVLALTRPAAAQSHLLGVTGDIFAGTPETLFVLDKATAGPTFYMTLGNGGIGETIHFNPDDGFLYHASGTLIVVFERVNLATRTVAGNIPLAGGAAFSRWTGLAYAGGGLFYFVNANDQLWTVTTTGASNLVGNLDHEPGALAFWFGNLYTMVGQLSPADQLRRIDPATGATLSTVTVTLPGFVVRGGYGLATDPGTGRLFAVLLVDGVQPWQLVTLDPVTGNATLVGGLGDEIIDITFTPSADVTPVLTAGPTAVPTLPPAFLVGLASLLLIGGAALIARRGGRIGGIA